MVSQTGWGHYVSTRVCALISRQYRLAWGISAHSAEVNLPASNLAGMMPSAGMMTPNAGSLSRSSAQGRVWRPFRPFSGAFVALCGVTTNRSSGIYIQATLDRAGR